MAVIKSGSEVQSGIQSGGISIQGTPQQFGATLGDQAGDIERVQATKPAVRASTNARDAAAWRSVGNSVIQIGLRQQEIEDRIALGDITDIINASDLEDRKSDGILQRTGYATRGIFEAAEARKKELEEKIAGIGDDRIRLRKEEILRQHNAQFDRNVNTVKIRGDKWIAEDQRRKRLAYLWNKMTTVDIDPGTGDFMSNDLDMISQGAFELSDAAQVQGGTNATNALRGWQSIATSWNKFTSAAYRKNLMTRISMGQTSLARAAFERNIQMFTDTDRNAIEDYLKKREDGDRIDYMASEYKKAWDPLNSLDEIENDPSVPEDLKDDLVNRVARDVLDQQILNKRTILYYKDSAMDQIGTGNPYMSEEQAMYTKDENVPVMERLLRRNPKIFAQETTDETREYFEDISDSELREMGLSGLEKFATSMSLQDFRQMAKYISRLDLEGDIAGMINERRRPQTRYEAAIIGNAWYKRPIKKASNEDMDAYVQYKQSGQVHRDDFQTIEDTWENRLPDELYNDLIEEKISGEPEDRHPQESDPEALQEMQEFIDSGEPFYNTRLKDVLERFEGRISLEDRKGLIKEWRKGEPSFIEETPGYVLDEIQDLFDSPEFPQMTMEEIGFDFRHRVSEQDWNRIISEWSKSQEDKRGTLGGDMEGWVRTELNLRADAWFPDADPEDEDARFRLRRRTRGQYVRFRNSRGLVDSEETVNMFLEQYQKQLMEDGGFGIHPLDTEEDLDPLYEPTERELNEVTTQMARMGRHVDKKEAERIIMLQANIETPRSFDPEDSLRQNELALKYVEYINSREKLDTAPQNLQYTPEEAASMSKYRPEVFLISIPYLYPDKNIPYSVDYAIINNPEFDVTSGSLGAFYDAVYLKYGQLAMELGAPEEPGILSELWGLMFPEGSKTGEWFSNIELAPSDQLLPGSN